MLHRRGSVVGWRVWRVVLLGGRLQLWSAVYDEEWPLGAPFTATCGQGHAHAAPADGCTCGVYALSDPEGLRRYLVGRDDPWVVGRVLGEVELWGEVVEGELGWRAQFARPRRIVHARVPIGHRWGTGPQPWPDRPGPAAKAPSQAPPDRAGHISPRPASCLSGTWRGDSP